jgi:site-specific DNA-cytosine methylase
MDELDEKDRFYKLSSGRKRLTDTMFAYRSETAMISLLKAATVDSSKARDLLQDLFATQADILPEAENNILRVRVHNASRSAAVLSRKSYRAIPHEGMNRFDLQRLAPELTPACLIRKKTGGTDLFGRLWWDRPPFTIRTEFFKLEKGRYLNPVQNRPITHREAARFQTFPDSFRFSGSKIEIVKQIGNAVTPHLDARVGDIVRLLLDQKYKQWMSSQKKNEAKLCRA